MKERPKDLPDFSDPPLDEVAIAVQFKELETFLGVHYGMLYERFKTGLPHYEEHLPLPTKFETFGRSIEGSQSIEIQTRPPLRRVWFVSKNGHQLVQIQPNRFVHNWRKVSGKGDYPRFESILPTFLKELRKFKKFVKDANLGKIEINQCELSYFNNIYKLKNENLHGTYSRAFRCWRDTKSNFEYGLSKLQREAPRFTIASRVLTRSDSEPIGRLFVEALPAANSETGEELIRLVLVFRGHPTSTGEVGLENFLSIGREAIVETFTSITTDQYHNAWGRKV